MELTSYSDEQLAQLKSQIESEMEARKSARKQAIVNEIKAKAEAAGLSAEELALLLSGKKRVTRKAAIKYRDPKNGDNTWTGRGRKPRWVEAHLSSGGSLEQLSV